MDRYELVAKKNLALLTRIVGGVSGSDLHLGSLTVSQMTHASAQVD